MWSMVMSRLKLSLTCFCMSVAVASLPRAASSRRTASCLLISPVAACPVVPVFFAMGDPRGCNGAPDATPILTPNCPDVRPEKDKARPTEFFPAGKSCPDLQGGTLPCAVKRAGAAPKNRAQPAPGAAGPFPAWIRPKHRGCRRHWGVRLQRPRGGRLGGGDLRPHHIQLDGLHRVGTPPHHHLEAAGLDDALHLRPVIRELLRPQLEGHR